jgi:dTDP-4-dehydrorhamnose reductase
VIHAAALVGARICEEQPDRCLDVNVGGTINLVLAARALGARLVYISTDYVFDGTAGPYRETDPVSPINLYGASKAAGERVVLGHGDALVIRTSFCSFHSWKFDGALTDQYSSRDDVLRIAPQVLEAAASSLRGILHIGGDRRSVYDLARSIEPGVKPLSIAATGLPLPRDVSLDRRRWQQYRAGR